MIDDLKKNKNIEEISRRAMESQLISFRIEGIIIPKKRAEEIRREVVKELQKKQTRSLTYLSPTFPKS